MNFSVKKKKIEKVQHVDADTLSSQLQFLRVKIKGEAGRHCGGRLDGNLVSLQNNTQRNRGCKTS